MKPFLVVGVAGLLAVTGAVASITSADQIISRLSGDFDFWWRSSSGPNGERDPKAQPLYAAIFNGNDQEVADLLKAGRSPNAVLYPGMWSPLMAAIATRNLDMVKLLIKNGADLDYVANDAGRSSVLELAFQVGTHHDDFSILYYMVDSGSDINLSYNYGSNVAVTACALGQMDIVNYFLDKGLDSNLERILDCLKSRSVTENVEKDRLRAIERVARMMENNKAQK